MEMAETLGTPLSEVTELCVSGNWVYKIKLLLPIKKPLKDSMEVTHPTLGIFNAFIVYERVNRVFLFCGILGHKNSTCGDKIRVQRLLLDPKYKNRVFLFMFLINFNLYLIMIRKIAKYIK